MNDNAYAYLCKAKDTRYRNAKFKPVCPLITDNFFRRGNAEPVFQRVMSVPVKSDLVFLGGVPYVSPAVYVLGIGGGQQRYDGWRRGQIALRLVLFLFCPSLIYLVGGSVPLLLVHGACDS